MSRERFACMLRRRAGLDAHEFATERVDTRPTIQSGTPSAVIGFADSAHVLNGLSFSADEPSGRTLHRAAVLVCVGLMAGTSGACSKQKITAVTRSLLAEWGLR